MTTVFDAGTAGPRTHALVIGVGQYPYCTDASLTEATGIEGALARQFDSVTSPPASARTFAEWLMTHQAGDPAVPLGSVELLMSPPADGKAVVNGQDGVVTVAPPTLAAVREAFDRWFARCDTSEDNVAMFYFSGHGCEQNEQFALLEDIGRDPLRFFANAINVNMLVEGMTRCAAHTQCYFIDACRTVPHEVLELSRIASDALIQPYTHRPVRNVALIPSAARGCDARGVKGGTTLFTDVLLEALSGGAAVRHNSQWGVDVSKIAVTVNQLLEWHGERRQPPPDPRVCQPRIIRQLGNEPLVPFRFGCEPREALASAALCLVDHQRSDRMLVREPVAALWEDSTAPSFMSSLRADFSDHEYDATCEQMQIMPPCVEEDLHVSGGRRGHG
ncbi:caspase family protein [Kibdelosporangium aridum]|uniref:caspase family protein n=1 Tax=Kibdelosporangium aridum TaxID=2030 RepID=UPI0035EA3E26